MHRIWIMTVLPEYFKPFMSEGVVGQLLSGKRGDKQIEINLVNIRDYGHGNHHAVDDSPFGGGPGMIFRPDILERALLEGVVAAGNYKDIKQELAVVYTSARGCVWNADTAKQFKGDFWEMEESKDLVFLCGRYEGVDERFLEQYVDKEYSLGSFVLSGGELAVMTILDSALRFVGGTLSNVSSPQEDSFEHGMLDYPQFTRPAQFNGTQIPEVLISGHHANIKLWRQQQKLEQTKKYRPDLLKGKNEK